VIADLLAPPLCWSCRAPAARGRALCRQCRRELRFLPRAPVVLAGVTVWAPVAYEGPASELVKALKFRSAVGVAGEMAALVVAGAPPGMLAGSLVPVPPHPARARRRGIDQAAALATAIAARTELPVASALRRSGPNERQVGRSRAARLHGPADRIEASVRMAGRAVVVDDVVTTGATLAACAAALRAAGAPAVEAIAFARTPGR
jgi:predicted amidophosphoribosyltransferase